MTSMIQTQEVSPPQGYEDRERIAKLPVRPRFELSRLLTNLAGLLVVAYAIEFFLSPGWRWHVVAEHLFHEQVLIGIGRSISLSVLSLMLGMVIGLVVCAARLSQYALLRTMALLYIWLVRALPIMVVLLFIYFMAALVPQFGIGIPGLPPLIALDTTAFITQFGAALVGLSLYFGGKAAEIFRGGYLAVGTGQHEAVKVLGLGKRTALTKVTGPQAARVLIPPLANEVVTMFKNTSIVTVIGYGELLTTVQKMYSDNGETIPMLTVACIWYLAITSLLMLGQVWIEKRLGRGYNLPSSTTRHKS